MSHVWIIDDDQDDREIFCEIVRDINISINCLAWSGAEEALNCLRSFREPTPNLIFLDFNMPKMNGLQCLIELKEDILLNNIPVIMYSTGCTFKEMNYALQLGAVNYITKPSCYAKTLNAVQFFLNAYNLTTKRFIS
jgi:CheY-like chemotaxis protein